MRVIVKFLVRVLVTFFLMFEINLVYGFVGGAHGGFSGGGAHGGFSGGGYSNSSSNSNYSHEPVGFAKIVMIWVVILCLLLSLLWLKIIFNQTKLGKLFNKIKQKRYIKKCHHTPVKPKRLYTSIEIQNATESLKNKAMEEVQKLHYLSNSSHHQLSTKALKSFEQLQKAWVERSTTRVLRACNNDKYSQKLSKQIEKMTSLDVYNYIDKTHITECHFVKFYKPILSHFYILRFVIKGEQIDEYTTKKYPSNEGFKKRTFNCLVDLIPYKTQFKIYQVKIDQHTDDYVIKEGSA